jgi:hypothetical protein
MDPVQAQSSNATQNAGRRRALQGLAAPLVMTVVPGSALATGSVGLCLNRCDEDARGYKKVSAFKSNLDDWVRVQRQLYKLKIKKKKGGYDDLGSRRFFLGKDGSTFWELKTVSGKLTGVKTGYIKGSPSVQYTQVNSYTYAIAYVDRYGEVKSFGVENTHSGKISSTSCWNSLKGLKAGGSKFLQF